MPKWFPSGNAIKKELILGAIAGAVAFGVGYYLKKWADANG